MVAPSLLVRESSTMHTGGARGLAILLVGIIAWLDDAVDAAQMPGSRRLDIGRDGRAQSRCGWY